jgi:hypothetical protein
MSPHKTEPAGAASQRHAKGPAATPVSVLTAARSLCRTPRTSPQDCGTSMPLAQAASIGAGGSEHTCSLTYCASAPSCVSVARTNTAPPHSSSPSSAPAPSSLHTHDGHRDVTHRRLGHAHVRQRKCVQPSHIETGTLHMCQRKRRAAITQLTQWRSCAPAQPLGQPPSDCPSHSHSAHTPIQLHKSRYPGLTQA